MINIDFEKESNILENVFTSDIEEIKREFSERHKELSQIVYTISHDLSSPLKSIRGLLSVAKLEKTSNAKNELLNLMENRVSKLESYIKDVTNLLSNSNLGIIREKVIFKEVVDEILGNLDYCKDFDKINFRRRFSTNAMIVTDPVRLKIILNNLITNAMKFHVLDGYRDPRVDISLEHSGNENRITVSDNGRGIEKKHLDKIFEMFFRGTSSCEGSGLGLYITKETVKKLEGSISVKSKIYEGTHFIVKLPRFAA